MLRSRLSLPAALLCLFSLAACSDHPTDVTRPGSVRSTVITPTETLDQSIGHVFALFPKGLENAAATRWANVKRKYAAGLTNPSQMKVAKQMLFELSDWVNTKTPEMASPPNNETKTAASARAVLYMSMYVYSGPGTSPPPFTPSADAVVGIVTPGAPATIVTPTKHAGVQFEAGSVDENTIVVVTQNPAPFPANCSGPLQTKLCQYPLFYTFEQFPHKRLLKAAKFAVCHVNSGEQRQPLADHDRFRLAHSKPGDPASYTPGSTIRDQDGESIEILPLVTQTFSTCEDTHHHATNTVQGGLTELLTRFAHGVHTFVTPKNAYAIDVGLGGLGFEMSPFNVVDPIGTPDRAVQSLNVTPACNGEECVLRAGGHVRISYSVSNVGTATAGSVPAELRMVSVPQNPEDPGVPIDVRLGFVTIPTLVPGAVANASNLDFVIPPTLSAGNYTITLSVGDETTFPELTVSLPNNVALVPVDVATPVDSGPVVVRVCATADPGGVVTVPNLQLAMDLVAPAGTIRICDGTYMVTQMNLNLKSMIIEGEGPGLPTLDAANTAQVFYMNSPTPVFNSVILRRLRLKNGEFGPLNVSNHHAYLTIDQVEFHAPNGPTHPDGLPDAGYLAGVGIFNSTGPEYVWVLNSSFIGGDIGVHMNNAANVVINGNTFTGQLNAAIHAGNGGNFEAVGNTITNCGRHWCVGIFNNDVTGNFRLINNRFTIGFDHPTANVMALHHGVYEVRGNVISGVGGSRDPANPASWPINNAIFINENSTATVSSNRIEGAYVGLNFVSGTSATGTNNVVTNVNEGMRIFVAGPVSITRSDFTNYTRALDTDATTAVASCNWWGSPVGPQGVAPWISPATYTPWSTSPIANQPNVGCGQ